MATFGQKVKAIKRSENKILLPRALKWLEEHPSFTVSEENVAELVRITTSGDNNVRHGRFGASSRGDCKRQQVLKYLGAETMPHTDFQLSNIFLDGTWRHVRWQMMGLEAGWFTDIEVPLWVPEYRLGVSADALNRTEAWGFELKGTSQLDSVVRNGVPEKHLMQIHTMMLGFGLDTWVYLAEDKARQSLHEIVVHRDEKYAHAVQRELEILNEHVTDRTLPDVLPACGERRGATFNGCPFRGVCLDFDAEAVPTAVWIGRGGVES